jgi:hypothetical protein
MIHLLYSNIPHFFQKWTTANPFAWETFLFKVRDIFIYIILKYSICYRANCVDYISRELYEE